VDGIKKWLVLGDPGPLKKAMNHVVKRRGEASKKNGAFVGLLLLFLIVAFVRREQIFVRG